jgi:hypothetical protein
MFPASENTQSYSCVLAEGPCSPPFLCSRVAALSPPTSFRASPSTSSGKSVSLLRPSLSLSGPAAGGAAGHKAWSPRSAPPCAGTLRASSKESSIATRAYLAAASSFSLHTIAALGHGSANRAMGIFNGTPSLSRHATAVFGPCSAHRPVLRVYMAAASSPWGDGRHAKQAAKYMPLPLPAPSAPALAHAHARPQLPPQPASPAFPAAHTPPLRRGHAPAAAPAAHR